MDTLDFYVQNLGLAGVRVNIGQREVEFNADGVAGPLTEAEHSRLVTIPGFVHHAAIMRQRIAELEDLRVGEALPAEGEAPKPPALAEHTTAQGMDTDGSSDAVDLAAVAEVLAPFTEEAPTESPVVDTPALVEAFRGLPQEARLEMVENGGYSPDQLRALFDSEAKWPKSKRVLAAIDRAIAKVQPARTAEQVNLALIQANTPRQEEV